MTGSMKLERRFRSPRDLYRYLLNRFYPHEKMQEPKRQTAYCYSDGPMFFLGQQIVKAMQDAGFPAKIVWCYRTHQKQAQLYAQGRTAPGRKVTWAKPFQSAHQYYEAVDICHKSKGWDVTEEFWTALAACVRIVGDKYGVLLTHGHDWDGDGIPVHLDPDERKRDSAHIQLTDWRKQARAIGHYKPTEAQLWHRFQQVLPDVAKRIIQDGRVP